MNSAKHDPAARFHARRQLARAAATLRARHRTRRSAADATTTMTIPNAAGTAVTAALTGLATLHAYWALGGSWPGHDDRSLAETVVGPGAALPPTPATWAVAGLLATSAAAMASTTAGRGPRVPVLAITWATGVALLARGGIGLPASLASGLDTRFGQLDALIYSPLCLALGAATILVARRSPQRHPTRGTAIVSRYMPTRPLSHG